MMYSYDEAGLRCSFDLLNWNKETISQNHCQGGLPQGEINVIQERELRRQGKPASLVDLAVPSSVCSVSPVNSSKIVELY